MHGGDVARAYAVDLDDGRTVFAKTHPAAPPHFFTTEAAGLALAATRAGGPIAVPEVLAVSDDAPNHLVLEWIDEGGARADGTTERRFGAALAALHAAGAPCFGREDRRTTGSRGLPNEPCATWAEFYATEPAAPARPPRARRRRARRRPRSTALERVAGRLDDFGGADEPPARLHGDLWAGNRLVDADGPALADRSRRARRPPRVRPRDDAALRRLRRRVLRRVRRTCRRSRRDGRSALPLHQIAPLVVHAIKFGGGYVASATEAIARYT